MNSKTFLSLFAIGAMIGAFVSYADIVGTMTDSVTGQIKVPSALENRINSISGTLSTAVQPGNLATASVATAGTATNWVGEAGLGSAAYSNDYDFATAAQGGRADTALQRVSTNDLYFIKSPLDTAAPGLYFIADGGSGAITNSLLYSTGYFRLYNAFPTGNSGVIVTENMLSKGVVTSATNALYATTATNWTQAGTAAYSNASAFAAASHVSDTNNPHNVTAAQIGALTAEADTLNSITARGASTSNRLNVAGITSTGASTNSAPVVWRSSGSTTTASVDNETGTGVFATASIRGKDSNELYDSLACSTNSYFGYVNNYSYKYLKPVCWGIGTATNVVVYTDKNMGITNGLHYGALALSTTNGWAGVVHDSGSFTASDSTTTYPASVGPTVSNWKDFFANGTTVYWAEIRGSFATFPGGATLSPISHTNAIAVSASAAYDVFSYGTPLLLITGTDHYSGHAHISIFTGDGNVEALDFMGRANGSLRTLSTPIGYSWTGSQNNRIACGGNRYLGNCVSADTNAFFLFRGYAAAASTNVTSSPVWQGKWSFDQAPSHTATVIPYQ